jgi:hypothetical protein
VLCPLVPLPVVAVPVVCPALVPAWPACALLTCGTPTVSANARPHVLTIIFIDIDASSCCRGLTSAPRDFIVQHCKR